MSKIFYTTGLAGEPINWSLLSRQLIDGMIQSVYEAPSTCFNRTYHLITIESDNLDAQHLSIL